MNKKRAPKTRFRAILTLIIIFLSNKKKPQKLSGLSGKPSKYTQL